MKTVEISSGRLSVGELFEMAKQDALLVKTAHGESFLVSQADELGAEAELLRTNRRFLELLDRLKGENDSIPLEQIEEALR